MNENQMVELTDGRLLMNARHAGGNPNRIESHSGDGGATWSPAQNSKLPGTQCMASIIRLTDPLDGFSQQRLLFSGHQDAGRDQGTIWVSYDEGDSWGKGKLLEPGGYAYSVTQAIDCETIGSLYETAGYSRIRLGLFSLNWQSDDADTLQDEAPCIDCVTDLDGNGVTDVSDLLSIISAWGPCKSCDEDLNGSGIVDVTDLLIIIGNWGPCE
jgi:sialidase-1